MERAHTENIWELSQKEESDIDSFLDGFAGELFEERITGLDDFELICFLVIK